MENHTQPLDQKTNGGPTLAKIACDQCHRCKLRCTRELPQCERCRKTDSPCTFSTGKPLGKPKGSKNKVKTATAGQQQQGQQEQQQIQRQSGLSQAGIKRKHSEEIGSPAMGASLDSGLDRSHRPAHTWSHRHLKVEGDGHIETRTADPSPCPSPLWKVGHSPQPPAIESPQTPEHGGQGMDGHSASRHKLQSLEHNVLLSPGLDHLFPPLPPQFIHLATSCDVLLDPVIAGSTLPDFLNIPLTPVPDVYSATTTHTHTPSHSPIPIRQHTSHKSFLRTGVGGEEEICACSPSGLSFLFSLLQQVYTRSPPTQANSASLNYLDQSLLVLRTSMGFFERCNSCPSCQQNESVLMLLLPLVRGAMRWYEGLLGEQEQQVAGIIGNIMSKNGEDQNEQAWHAYWDGNGGVSIACLEVVEDAQTQRLVVGAVIRTEMRAGVRILKDFEETVGEGKNDSGGGGSDDGGGRVRAALAEAARVMREDEFEVWWG
ncbi:hypothetical protein MKZ38_002330 [Zalerion maritima]|uniref:Zn(2)-C6 fungal-type domain-containing protein n=1 Tax=Zalerion maritima TaxID=339359 RepID=A0AAD5WXT5_9PEZI|nr:hypothetical protein MKZ38_002330 [Zalerion maritima]